MPPRSKEQCFILTPCHEELTLVASTDNNPEHSLSTFFGMNSLSLFVTHNWAKWILLFLSFRLHRDQSSFTYQLRVGLQTSYDVRCQKQGLRATTIFEVAACVQCWESHICWWIWDYGLRCRLYFVETTWNLSSLQWFNQQHSNVLGRVCNLLRRAAEIICF